MTWNGPLAWRLSVTATDGGRHPQEKDKLSDKHAARYRTSAGRQAPERGGDGDGNRKGKGVKREQATDESPSVFRGEQGYQRENKPNSH